eukprot:COSAG02_NODE_38_length_48090_cov_107.207060_19_plen_190_part_00
MTQQAACCCIRRRVHTKRQGSAQVLTTYPLRHHTAQPEAQRSLQLARQYGLAQLAVPAVHSLLQRRDRPPRPQPLGTPPQGRLLSTQPAPPLGDLAGAPTAPQGLQRLLASPPYVHPSAPKSSPSPTPPSNPHTSSTTQAIPHTPRPTAAAKSSQTLGGCPRNGPQNAASRRPRPCWPRRAGKIQRRNI